MAFRAVQTVPSGEVKTLTVPQTQNRSPSNIISLPCPIPPMLPKLVFVVQDTPSLALVAQTPVEPTTMNSSFPRAIEAIAAPLNGFPMLVQDAPKSVDLRICDPTPPCAARIVSDS